MEVLDRLQPRPLERELHLLAVLEGELERCLAGGYAPDEDLRPRGLRGDAQRVERRSRRGGGCGGVGRSWWRICMEPKKCGASKHQPQRRDDREQPG
jgi:hypothetical protein